MANDSKTWRCGKYELSFDRPRIMGVLNVTPDSFSDGGEHFDPDAAIEYGLAMLDAGADIIDVGGESTRPGFTPVNPDEEARRVLPVVRALAKEGAIVSIDTRHVAVAKAAVRCGASWRPGGHWAPMRPRWPRARARRSRRQQPARRPASPARLQARSRAPDRQTATRAAPRRPEAWPPA